jgi:uncharacterized repeat protein (TIGR01451 family)
VVRFAAGCLAAAVASAASIASAQTPGGVAGPALWIKADQGVQATGNQVEQWIDQSASGNTTTELRASLPTHTDPITPSSSIVLTPSSINFNPTVDFNGTSGRSLKGNAATNWTTGGLSIFGVSVVSGTPSGLGGLAAVWDAHANWTTAFINTAGAGLVATGTIYNLDGNACGTANTTGAVNVPNVVRGTYVTGNNALGGSTWVNGGQQGTGGNCGNVATTFFEVGGRTAGDAAVDGRILKGKIAEVVVFKSDLAAANDDRVESYLAVKYGITLRATGGGAHDYVTSAGTTIWSGVANSAYHNAVAGIAADSGSALDQRVSQSVIAGDQVAIAAGNFAFTGTITAQSPAATIASQSALMWGHNNQATAATVPVTDPVATGSGVEVRMSRVWRTQVTAGAGLPAQTSIRIPATLVETGNTNLRDIALLISTTADFSTGTRTPIPLTKSGSFYYATFSTFTAGEFFTVAGAISQPADLSIVKTAPATMVAGTTVTYTLTVTNNGGFDAPATSVSDTLPASLTFVSSSPACSAAGQVVTCNLGTLTNGQVVPISLNVRIAPDTPAGTVISNTASVTSTAPDPTPANNTSTVASPAVTTSADLSTTKAAVETSVAPGGTFTYRVVVTNNGSSTASNVTVTDPLPAQLAFVSSPSGCSAVAQNVTCGPVATLAPGSATTFDIVVRLAPTYTGNGSDIGNVATASSSTPDPNPTNDSNPPAPPPTVTAPQSDVQIVKSVSAAPAPPGGTYTYTLNVTNNGPSAATNVTVTDALPASTTFVSSAAACTASGQNVICPTEPTLDVGVSMLYDIVVQLSPTYTGDGSDILNTATVTSTSLDPSLQNNSNPAGAPPVGPPGADVAIVKTVSAGPINPGETFTYTLLVSNQGPSVAANVIATDPLPAGVTLVSSVEGCTAVGQDVTCPAIASLNAGESVSYHLLVRLDASYVGDGSDLPNTATVASDTPDPVPGNNTSAPVTPQVGNGSSDLSITKTIVGGAVAPGTVFTYRIVVANAGPSTAHAVSVTDTLPAPLTFVSSPASCTAAGQVVTCTQATVATGGTATFDLLVRLDSAYAGNGTDIMNTATVTASTPDPTPTNNTSTPAGPLPIGVGSADLSVSLVGPYDAVPAGGEITYTIVVTNQGPNAALDVILDGATPAGLTFVASAGDCTTPFPCSLGTLLPGQTRTITVRYSVAPSVTAVTHTVTTSSSTPDPSLPNNSATASTPADAVTYYLAEGATGTFWDEDVLIANPNAAPAPVTMRFFREDGSIMTKTLTVAAMSHVAVRVDDLPGLEATVSSAQITSDSGLPLAVERTMTWDATGYGGHTETAVTRPSTKWYFAEGAQGYFDTYLLLENPNSVATDVTVTFLREGNTPLPQTLTIGAHSRYTVQTRWIPELAGSSFGIVVDATQPIVAERSMYFGTLPTRLWSGGHSSAGVTDAAQRWFYAEGATGSFFTTFILLSNPQMVAANVTLEYILPDGTVIPATVVVPAQGRLTVKVDDNPDPRLQSTAVSTRITSDVPIVTERSMYWDTKPDVTPWSEGHNSFGIDQTSLRWGLAEGRVGGPRGYHTYVLLSNPWATGAQVTVTYLRDSGAPIVKNYVVPPTSRFTIDVNSEVPELQDEWFGARVEVTNGFTINVERSIYWQANGIFWAAGTNAAGTRLP